MATGSELKYFSHSIAKAFQCSIAPLFSDPLLGKALEADLWGDHG
jgi:hypothetical protein